MIIVSRRPRRQDIENIILSGIEKCNEIFPEDIETLKISSLIPEPAILRRIFCEYDLVIGDVSGTAHETIYQVGLAQGCDTPVLLTSDENGRPVLWEFNNQYCNSYPKTGNVESFINRLSTDILIVNNAMTVPRSTGPPQMQMPGQLTNAEKQK